ncbi:MAG: hypothetical protein H6714_10625 [Myxococcales bacterium]|nr:hypothetical protein [Myxococcales bacterium]
MGASRIEEPVEGGGYRTAAFKAALVGLIDACGATLNIQNLTDYISLREYTYPPAQGGYYYVLFFNFKALRAHTGIACETLYEACMPLVEDPET